MSKRALASCLRIMRSPAQMHTHTGVRALPGARSRGSG